MMYMPQRMSQLSGNEKLMNREQQQEAREEEELQFQLELHEWKRDMTKIA